ncbi:MAG: VWA domain-containing protein [Gammaproteobacteria bacterium]|nr:VWA domain-containing protein [Gammaproteobacteria bacterium]
MAETFQLLRPWWLLALLPIWLLALRAVIWRTTESPWRAVIDAHLIDHLLGQAHDPGSRWRTWATAIAGSLAVVALSGPAWERVPQPVFKTSQYQVIVLDLSPSMNAADVSPSRLARARFEILDLLAKSREGLTAMLAYGSEPFVVSPLTSDAATIAAQVPQLDTALLPEVGQRHTDLALTEAVALLQQAGARSGNIILVTDGLPDAATALSAARDAAAAGFSISVLALGTVEGAPVPDPEGGFFRDRQGTVQLARLDAEDLRTLARFGNGRYVQTTVDDSDIEQLMAEAPVASAAERSDDNAKSDTWRDEGIWLLLPLLPLGALAFRRGWLGVLAAVALCLPPPPASALSWRDLWQRPDQQAAATLAEGNAELAARQFKDDQWKAAAAYQSGEFSKTLESLADKPGADAAYNRGNAYARQGQLEQALAEYDDALATDENFEDARINRELVQKLLDQQKQEQQQNPNQGSQGNQSGEGEQERQASQDQQPGAQNESGEPGEDGEPQSQQADAQQNDSESQQGNEPSADDLSAERQTADASENGNQGDEEGDQSQQSGESEPGSADLAQQREQQGTPGEQSEDSDAQEQAMLALTKEKSENEQSIETQLRRVPDDPAGLLRQRFMLQHLRRNGEL